MAIDQMQLSSDDADGMSYNYSFFGKLNGVCRQGMGLILCSQLSAPALAASPQGGWIAAQVAAPSSPTAMLISSITPCKALCRQRECIHGLGLSDGCQESQSCSRHVTSKQSWQHHFQCHPLQQPCKAASAGYCEGFC